MSGLKTTEIIKGTAVADFAEELYEEVFDRRMRVPFKDLFTVSGKGKADFAAVYDEDLFIGFYYVFRYRDIAYIYYLAVTEGMRNRGYGTEITDLIKDTYPECRIVVSIEAPKVDDRPVSAPYRRLAFYSRNGFMDTLFKYESVGITYTVLYWGKTFDPEEEMGNILRNFRKLVGFRR